MKVKKNLLWASPTHNTFELGIIGIQFTKLRSSWEKQQKITRKCINSVSSANRHFSEFSSIISAQCSPTIMSVMS